jgi:hypothetical protein
MMMPQAKISPRMLFSWTDYCFHCRKKNSIYCYHQTSLTCDKDFQDINIGHLPSLYHSLAASAQLRSPYAIFGLQHRLETYLYRVKMTQEALQNNTAQCRKCRRSQCKHYSRKNPDAIFKYVVILISLDSILYISMIAGLHFETSTQHLFHANISA